MNLLTVANLNVYYGRLQAVRDVSLSVPEAAIVTLLGANGAGKSSVLRALCGLAQAPGATIMLAGHDITRLAPQRRVRLGIAAVPEGRDLFPSLTVEENLRMGAYRRRERAAVGRDLEWIYGLFPVLAARRRATASSLSGGQGQMLAIGRALMAAPRLLLLDEPSHGLAPALVEELFRILPHLQQERGLAMLLVEQNAGEALRTASYGYVLESGSLALEGTTAELRHNPTVRRLYLGG